MHPYPALQPFGLDTLLGKHFLLTGKGDGVDLDMRELFGEVNGECAPACADFEDVDGLFRGGGWWDVEFINYMLEF